jgi:hypothetical protein
MHCSEHLYHLRERPRPIGAGALRRARLAARRTALIRLEAIERRAHGNLVGITRPDDEISYFFRRLPCLIGALQPRGVDKALRAWCFCHIVYGAAHRRGDIRLGRKDNARFVPILADFSGGHPSSPVCFGDRTQPNAVGGRDLWHEHDAESKNACPAHVELNPCALPFCHSSTLSCWSVGHRRLLCALRVAIGHAAVPPRSVMSLRRFTRSPHRRGREGSQAPRCRAPWRS